MRRSEGRREELIGLESSCVATSRCTYAVENPVSRPFGDEFDGHLLTQTEGTGMVSG